MGWWSATGRKQLGVGGLVSNAWHSVVASEPPAMKLNALSAKRRKTERLGLKNGIPAVSITDVEHHGCLPIICSGNVE